MTSNRTLLTIVFISAAVIASGIALGFAATGYIAAQQEKDKPFKYHSCSPSESAYPLCLPLYSSDEQIAPSVGSLAYLSGVSAQYADGYDPALGYVDDTGHEYSGYYSTGLVWAVGSGNYTGMIDISLNMTNGAYFKFTNLRWNYLDTRTPDYDTRNWAPLPDGAIDYASSNHSSVAISLPIKPGTTIGIFTDIQRIKESPEGTGARVTLIAIPQGDKNWHDRVLDSVNINPSGARSLHEYMGWMRAPMTLTLTYPVGSGQLQNVTRGNLTSTYSFSNMVYCRWDFDSDQCDLDSVGWQTTRFFTSSADHFAVIFGERYDPGAPIAGNATLMIESGEFDKTETYEIPIVDGQFLVSLKFHTMEDDI